jgi:Glycosyl hydrolase family 20, catalytic domain
MYVRLFVCLFLRGCVCVFAFRVQILSKEKNHLLLGGELTMSTENLDPSNIDSVLWPRGSAAAELYWRQTAATSDIRSRLEEWRCLLMEYVCLPGSQASVCFCLFVCLYFALYVSVSFDSPSTPLLFSLRVCMLCLIRCIFHIVWFRAASLVLLFVCLFLDAKWVQDHWICTTLNR